jgi:hypothetical protein
MDSSSDGEWELVLVDCKMVSGMERERTRKKKNKKEESRVWSDSERARGRDKLSCGYEWGAPSCASRKVDLIAKESSVTLPIPETATRLSKVTLECMLGLFNDVVSS